ncbi:MAG: hypothetical protein J5586_04050 [Clostridia bacterium]|nr:hypothetical protein [Clostridia bacterium]
MIKRILAVLLAAVFAAVCMPVSAVTTVKEEHPTPAGFDENDYQKVLAFMETEDSGGVKNGEKIVANFNGYYDPAYPDGWSYYYYDHENSILYTYGAFFTDTVPRRLSALCLYNMGLVGELDVSDCSELYEVTCDLNSITRLDVSGCPILRMLLSSSCEIEELNVTGCAGLDAFTCANNPISELDLSSCAALRDVDCSGCALTELNISGCSELNSLICTDNVLTELDVSGSPALTWLECGSNNLTELDITHNPQISVFDCSGNRISSLDLTCNPQLYFDSVAAAGPGYIGYELKWSPSSAYDKLTARPMGQNVFLGWYSTGGELISENALITSAETNLKNVVARFASPGVTLPGDANGDGTVTGTDAILVLRYALGLIDSSWLDMANADVDGSGVVTSSDAILILRASMGLILL